MAVEDDRKVLIAHRGASAYAPEHTLDAYSLAIEQGADFIEPDLQITQDGALICLHDSTLERTTDVQIRFSDRYREEPIAGGTRRRWHVSDFSLVEVKQLDAGSWFGDAFAGVKVPTLEEAIEIARGKVGVYPETKDPQLYGGRGLAMEELLLEVLERQGLAAPGRQVGTPVVIQSFSAESLRILRTGLGSALPLMLLVTEPSHGASTSQEGPAAWLTREGLKRVAEFAEGIGPAKSLVMDNPESVAWAHDLGLTVAAWTFRADEPGPFVNVTEEMAHFLYTLGVDALFTNNPDLFPR